MIWLTVNLPSVSTCLFKGFALFYWTCPPPEISRAASSTWDSEYMCDRQLLDKIKYERTFLLWRVCRSYFLDRCQSNIRLDVLGSFALSPVVRFVQCERYSSNGWIMENFD